MMHVVVIKKSGYNVQEYENVTSIALTSSGTTFTLTLSTGATYVFGISQYVVQILW